MNEYSVNSTNFLLKNIPMNEKIIFISDEISNEKLKKKEKSIEFAIYEIFFIIFAIFFYLSARWFNILIIFIWICIGMVLIGPSLFIRNYSISRIKHQFIFTEERIYIYRKDYLQGIEWVWNYDISSIIAITFRKRRLDGKGDYGTIEFIYGGINPPTIYKISFVPNFSKHHQISESILYHKTSIKEWFEKDEIKIKFPTPQIFTISKIFYYKLRKTQLIILIFSTFLLLVSIIGSSFILFRGSLNSFGSLFLFLILLVLALPISIIFLILYYIENKRISPLDSILTINKDSISLSIKNLSKTIDLNPHFSVHYLNTNINNQNTHELNVWKNGLKIIHSIDVNSSSIINFGPIDNFINIFEHLNKYILLWKAENGFLLTKQNLAAMQDQFKDIKSQHSKIYFKNVNDYLNEIPSEDQESIPSIELIKRELDKDEDILLIFKPKRRSYIFTNKRIIFPKIEKNIIIPYSNISSLGISFIKPKSKYYEIILEVYNPIVKSEYFNESVFYIHKILIEHDLIGLLIHLRQNCIDEK